MPPPAAAAAAAGSASSAPLHVLHRFDSASFVSATLLRRYKRFLADVRLGDDDAAGAGAAVANAAAAAPAPPPPVTVHCPNTGPMIGLLEHLPAPARLSVSDSATRKYAHTLEMIRRGDCGGSGSSGNSTTPTPRQKTNPPVWVGVRSALANSLAAEMIARGLLDEALGGPFERVEREVAYGGGNGGKAGGGGGGGKKQAPASRIDFVLHRPAAASASVSRTLHLEVKSVTLAEGDVPGLEDGPGGESDGGGDGAPAASPDGKNKNNILGIFPDTVSERASRHMRELAAVAARSRISRGEGDLDPHHPPAAACLFVVQRGDVAAVAPAWRLDAAYGRATRDAAAAGVALVAARCRVEPGLESDGKGGYIAFDGLVPVQVERGMGVVEEEEGGGAAARRRGRSPNPQKKARRAGGGNNTTT
jgi:DNA-binding sugar fermentation-stimulating protein